MLSVGLQSKSNIYFNNNAIATNFKSSQNNIAFKGGVVADSFVLLRESAPVIHKPEFNHIADVLKALGVQELELGDNIVLARLLKSAMKRVKRMGYDVPTWIRCESEIFLKNERLKRTVAQANLNMGYKNPIIYGTVSWNGLSEPIMYLNTKYNWDFGNNEANMKASKCIIWHETGHWLHIQNYTKNPEEYVKLQNIKLDRYQREIVAKSIGEFAAKNSVSETIAEIYTRFVSGEFYEKLHPEIFNIYSKYRGPMPRFKPTNG